jgi:hypothetical protein
MPAPRLVSNVFLETSMPSTASVILRLSLQILAATAPHRSTLYTGSAPERVPGYRPAELGKAGPDLPLGLGRQRDAAGSPLSSPSGRNDHLLDTRNVQGTPIAAPPGSAAEVHHPGGAPLAALGRAVLGWGRRAGLLLPPAPDCPGDRDLLVRSFCATSRNGRRPVVIPRRDARHFRMSRGTACVNCTLQPGG